MGRDATSRAAREAGADEAQDPIVARFARIMRERYGATVYLFGSRARGTATPESDYDLVAVSRAFEGQRWTTRVPNPYDLWHEAGAWAVGLDLHCYTPDEFREELAGLGFLGQAKRRGELRRIVVRKAA